MSKAAPEDMARRRDEARRVARTNAWANLLQAGCPRHLLLSERYAMADYLDKYGALLPLADALEAMAQVSDQAAEDQTP